MMRSLFAGVQGLRAHQVRMDVIGNNIANVNTVAFKASRANFADMYSQTLSGGSRATGSAGGTSPRQVGLGVDVSTIDVIQTQGSLQLTGKVTDMGIEGRGFFVLREGGRYVYSRAGGFDLDAEGNMVNPATGQRVQGWLPDSSGTFPARDSANMTNLRIPLSEGQLAQATTLVTFAQALNANAVTTAPGSSTQTAATVIDSLGKEHTINLTFTKAANNAWDITATSPAGAPIAVPNLYGAATIAPAPGAGVGRIQFGPDGSLMDDDANAATPFRLNMSYTPSNGASTVNFALDLTDVIQPAFTSTDATASTVKAVEFNGYPSGTLTNMNIDSRGVITGFYSNGSYREIGQVAVAAFANPGGLVKEGNNNWSESVNSGIAVIGAAGEGGRGDIAASSLEMSNVDLTAEFTSMIVTQRGFQANSRIITTTDEMLQEVVNLKR